MSGETKTRKDDFLLQGGILAIAAIITRMIGALYRIPLSNILGDEGRGFYGFAFEIYAIALVLTSFSFPIAISKLVSARIATGQRRNAYRVFKCAFAFAAILGLSVSALIFFGANWIAGNIMNSPMSAYALRVLAPGLFIVSIMSVLRGYFQGLGTMVPTGVSQVIEQIFNAVISIVGALALFNFGLRAAQERGNELLAPAYSAAGGTLGTVAGAIAGLLFLGFAFMAYNKTNNRKIRDDRTKTKESYKDILKVLIITIIPITFSTAIYNINLILNLIIFNHVMVTRGYTESYYMTLQGLFTNFVNPVLNIPLAMSAGIAAAVLPSLAATIATNRKEEIHVKINQTTRFTMLFALPSFVGSAVLASPIIFLLFNQTEWLRLSAQLLAIGAIMIVLYSWVNVSNSILQGLNKMQEPVKNAAISLIIQLIALVIMLVVFNWHVYALVVSNVIFAVCMCYLNVRSIRIHSGYRQEIVTTFMKPGIASLIMGVVAFGIYRLFDFIVGGRFIPATVAIFVAMVVYGVCVLKIGALSESDIIALPKGIVILRLVRKMRLL